jgi:hypothetical protein
MIRHIAVFRWKDGTTAEQVAEVQAALDRLPAEVPALRAYVHGPDLQLGEGRWDYCVTADVDDAAGYAAYDAHPAHQAVRTEVIGPLVGERAVVQLEVRASP